MMKIAFAANGAAVLCLLLYLLTNNIFLLGMTFVCAGGSFLMPFARKPAAGRSESLFYGILLVLYGLLIMSIPAGNERLGFIYTGYIIAWGLGILFASAVLFRIIRLCKCRYAVESVYLGAREHFTGKGVSYFIPRFRYYYQNRLYENIPRESFLKYKLKKNFRLDSTHTIYIDEKNPNLFVTRRRFTGNDVLLLFLAIVCFLLPLTFS